MLRGFAQMPDVVKNLLLLNVIMFGALFIFQVQGVDLNRILGLYYFQSEPFEPYQIVTHMFMHGGLLHLFFNMFALWLFGSALEQVWGAQRFLIYYFVCALGAAFLHEAVIYYQVQQLLPEMSGSQIEMVKENGYELIRGNQNYTNDAMGKLNALLHIPVVGASGAVFGLLLGFGMLFPNTELMLLFFPFPIKAKYFVIGYGLIELFSGVLNRPGDNIAHFAHLGGMLFGFILIKYWQKSGKKFY